ncbi:MAG: ATP-binding protein [Bdellovibrionota bacterium]
MRDAAKQTHEKGRSGVSHVHPIALEETLSTKRMFSYFGALLALAFIHFLWWALINRLSQSTQINPLSFFGVGFSLIGMALAAKLVPRIRAYFPQAFGIAMWLVAGHAFFNAYQSGAEPLYIVFCVLVLMTAGYGFSSRIGLICYGSFALVLACSVPGSINEVYKQILIVAVGATVAIGYVGVEFRLRKISFLLASTRPFEELMNSIPDGFWIYSLETNSLIFCNENLDRIWGRSRHELCRDPSLWISGVHAEDRERVKGFRKEIGQKEFEIEYRVVRPDGGIRHVKERTFPVTGESGTVERVKGVTVDITEKRALEERERLSLFMHHQILDSLSEMVLVKGPNSKIIWANKAFREYYGMSNEKLKDIIDAPFSMPDHTQQYVKDDAYVFNSGRVLDIPQEPVTRYNGEVRLFHTVKSPIVDDRGKVIMTVGISRDITDRVRAQKLIVEQRTKIIAGSKMSALGEMAGGVAHEINTPLAILSLLAGQIQEMAKEEVVDLEMLSKSAETIEQTTLRIGKIVSGLRNFSRDGAKDPFVQLDIKSMIEETLAFCKERFSVHGIGLIIEDFENLTIEARNVQIAQVLLNLLNNAYDAVATLPEKWVKVSVTRQPQWVEIAVTDSGPGIPKAQQQKIFEPFFTTKEIGKGTGLGLSIAKGIVEGHRGELLVDGNSKNTRFVIRLPYAQQGSQKKSA